MGRGNSGYTNTSTTTPQAPPPQQPPSQAPISSLTDAQTVDDLDQYMKAHHNVIFSRKLGHCDFGLMKDAAEDLDNLLNEFKQVGQLQTFKKVTIGADGSSYAEASYDGSIRVNSHKFDDASKIAQSYAYDLKRQFHVQNTSTHDIVVHEFGHQLERALIAKGVKNGSIPWYDGVRQWSSCTQAKKVIHDAFFNSKNAYGSKVKIADAIAKVSGYAKTNRSETLAECVTDYYRNGNNATPLSKAVWQILKRELG